MAPVSKAPASVSSSSSSSSEEKKQSSASESAPVSSPGSAPVSSPVPTPVSGSGSKSESEAESESQKSPIPKTPAVPVSSSSSESDSESESEDSPPAKRSRSKAGTAKKNNSAAAGARSSNGEQKALFQRIWSKDDEVAIVKGMKEFTAKKGRDPIGDPDFPSFIKKSISVDFSTRQLIGKAKRIKQKFDKNIKKQKEGNTRAFSKHEKKMFDLSKKLWGGEKKSTGNEKEISNMKLKFQIGRGSKVTTVTPTVTPALPVLKKHNEVEMVDEENREEVRVPVGEALNDLSFGMSGYEEEVVNNRAVLLSEDERRVLDRKRYELEMLTAEMYLKRLDYIQERVNMIVAAMRAAKK